MLYICFTADHELYFGENLVNEDEVVIKPTTKLLEVLGQYDIKLTLFTDICSIWRYRELGMEAYPEIMERQLLSSVESGHDVQLHLHPHWAKADYINQRWTFDPVNFRLHSLPVVEIHSLIAKGKEYLESLLRKVDASYSCHSFRAGGWCIQPEREIIESLLANGITTDSTVYRGGYRTNPYHYFDYRNTTMDSNWWIDSELGINYPSPIAGKGLFEIPIGSYYQFPYQWFWKLSNRWNKWRKWKHPIAIKGKSSDQARYKKTRALDKVIEFIKQPVLFSYDGYTSETMVRMVDYYLRKEDASKDRFISIIGHPKEINDNVLIEINQFLKTITSQYAEEVKFITFSEAANIVRANMSMQQD